MCARKQTISGHTAGDWMEDWLLPLKDICDRKMFSPASFVPARMPLVSYNSVVFRENICSRRLYNL